MGCTYRHVVLVSVLVVWPGSLTGSRPLKEANPSTPNTGRLPLDHKDNALPPGAVFRIGAPREWLNRLAGTVAFSPDGKRLAVGSEGILQLLDVATGKELHRWQGQSLNLGLAFSPDGKTVASLWYNQIVLWNVVTGTTSARAIGQDPTVFARCFSRDGRRLAFSLARSSGWTGKADRRGASWMEDRNQDEWAIG
jgi:WD40 repeat protein